MLIDELDPSWKDKLLPVLHPLFMERAEAFLEREMAAGAVVYPNRADIFNAFNVTPYDQVKVMIMGQDPYHGEGQAHGLSFSVPENQALPPSLKNIFKEIQSDVGGNLRTNGCLIDWAKQGVLLLNASLTVRKATPLSHSKVGWEQLTDAAVKALSAREDPVIFVLWGKFAEAKLQLVTPGVGHYVLRAAHPSPFSAHNGFFGCHHFSRINAILSSLNKEPIQWT